MFTVDSTIKIPMDEFRWSASRSSGPGGQNVNKVNSKVTLHWRVVDSPYLPDDVARRFQAKYAQRINADGELVLQSQRYRDQPKNRDDCLQKLRQLILSVRYAPRTRRSTRPTKASKERRLREKRHKAERKTRRQSPSWD